MAIKFQERVWRWAVHCFGPVEAGKNWNNMRERANRFCEEAIELCQSVHMSREDAHKIVDYVYNRPIGQPSQEIGGVLVTLAVLCECAGVDMEWAASNELDRCWMKIEVIRIKQETKKKDSALPQGD